MTALVNEKPLFLYCILLPVVRLFLLPTGSTSEEENIKKESASIHSQRQLLIAGCGFFVIFIYSSDFLRQIFKFFFYT
jgi:hypothetical protein